MVWFKKNIFPFLEQRYGPLSDSDDSIDRQGPPVLEKNVAKLEEAPGMEVNKNDSELELNVLIVDEKNLPPEYWVQSGKRRNVIRLNFPSKWIWTYYCSKRSP